MDNTTPIKLELTGNELLALGFLAGVAYRDEDLPNRNTLFRLVNKIGESLAVQPDFFDGVMEVKDDDRTS